MGKGTTGQARAAVTLLAESSGHWMGAARHFAKFVRKPEVVPKSSSRELIAESSDLSGWQKMITSSAKKDALDEACLRQPLEDPGLDGELEQRVERIDDQHKQHRGDRIALAKALTVRNRGARRAVDQDACRGRRDQNGNPLTPPRAKSHVLEHLKQEGPGDKVKCSRDIQLE